MLGTPSRFLSVHEFDTFLLDGQRINVTYAAGGEILECRIENSQFVIPSSLFKIYLRNRLIEKVARHQFAVTPLGQARLKRRA